MPLLLPLPQLLQLLPLPQLQLLPLPQLQLLLSDSGGGCKRLLALRANTHGVQMRVY